MAQSEKQIPGPDMWKYLTDCVRKALKTTKPTSKEYNFGEKVLQYVAKKYVIASRPASAAKPKTTFRWQCINPKCGKIHDKAELIKCCPSCKSQDIRKLVDDDDQDE